jgi:ferric-dicitrate binding protein FerR (iron transport regulator)
MTTKELLLAKYYRGECNREEMELLLTQLQESKDGDYSAIMDQLWEQLTDYPELDKPAATRILDTTLRRIENSDTRDREGEKGKSHRRRKFNFFRRLSAAAVFLGIMAVAFWLWRPLSNSVKIHTAYGEQRMITLPDESTVKLNANSSIRFFEDWEEESVRKVWLEGEAYFQVRKDVETERKFQVITRDLTVEVLGTIFNVNTREEATEVFLEEGKVHVDLERSEDDLMMDPGELVTYSVKTRQPQKRKVVQEEAPASWKDGTIILQKASLRYIIEKMEEIYGISTRVENEILLNRTFNFPMPVDNLDTAFLLLQESTGLVMERKADELIIK